MNYKRITAFFLSVVMVIGVLPALALASDEGTNEEQDQAIVDMEPDQENGTASAENNKEPSECFFKVTPDKHEHSKPTDEDDSDSRSYRRVHGKKVFDAEFPGNTHVSTARGVVFSNVPAKTVAYRVVDDGRHFYCYELSASDLNNYFFGHMSGSFKDTIYIKIEEGSHLEMNGKTVSYDLGNISINSKKYTFVKYDADDFPTDHKLSQKKLNFNYTYKIEFGKGIDAYDADKVFEDIQGLDLTYTGEAQEMLDRKDLKNIDDGYMFFISKNPGNQGKYYQNSYVPKQTEPGTYVYKYKVYAIDNTLKRHIVSSDSNYYSFTTKIEKPAPVIKAPEAINVTYEGIYRKLVTPGETSVGKFLYSLEADGKYEASIPRAIYAGTYTVYYKVVDANNHELAAGSVDVQIAKATPNIITPKAKVLTFSGEYQTLLVRGITLNGTFMYSLDGVNYSEKIPTGKTAGVYDVYYKVIGDKNHTDLDPAIISVTIDPKMVNVVEVFTDSQQTTIKHEAGTKLDKPVNPKLYGYDFAGWYTSETFEEEYDFDKEVGVEGLTIYAKWNKVTYDFKDDTESWTQDSGKDLVITAKRNVNDETTFDHFVGIEIDGQIVDASNYKAERGSVIVTLSKDYLKNLKAGDHTVKLLFDDNDSISTALSIKAAQPAKGADKESAQTGEHASVLVLILAVVLLVSGAVTGLIAKKSKNN